MDNKFGIIGYYKEETKYFKSEIIASLISSLIISLFTLLIILFLMIAIFYPQFDINMIFFISLFVFIFVIIFVIICAKECSDIKRLYIYFKDEKSQDSYNKNRYKFEEITNFLLSENIKPINKDNNLSDIYSISYEIDNERINFYNKLKDKYKIVDF